MNLESANGLISRVLAHVLVEVNDTPITVGRVIAAAAVVAGALMLSWILRKSLIRGLRHRGITSEGTLAASGRLTHYLVVIVGAGFAIRTMGIDISALFAAGAVFALGVSFAMQNIAQNFVSGVILLLERSIQPGDVLEVEGRMVRVREMGIRATYARTLDDEEIIVPNSTIVQSTVKSFTLRDPRYRLRAKVGVSYGSDMAKVRSVLEEVARDFSGRLTEEAPRILLFDFADSSVVWEVSVWINDPWRMRSLRSTLLQAIWWAFKENGIVIAYPQVDVHVDPDVLAAIERRTGVS